MKTTYAERLIAGLLALGWQLDTRNGSAKYTAFTKPTTANKAFVGPHGALRIGECATRSYSIGDANNQTAKYLMVLKASEPKS